MRRSLKEEKGKSRKGAAFPHCAAAERAVVDSVHDSCGIFEQEEDHTAGALLSGASWIIYSHAAQNEMRNILNSSAMRFILPALILVVARTCMACDCVDLSAAESLKKADLVFIGEVITSDKSISRTTFTFQVDQILKGTESQSAVVTSDMTDCDFDLYTGNAYIVYTSRFDDRLIAPSCMSTKLLDVSTQQQRSFVH